MRKLSTRPVKARKPRVDLSPTRQAELVHLKAHTNIRHEELAKRAEREGWTFEHHLRRLSVFEVSERQTRRLERQLRQSGLASDETLAKEM